MGMFERLHRSLVTEPEGTVIDHRDPADRWDWSSTMFVVLIVVIVLALTFEMWVPHFGFSNH